MNPLLMPGIPAEKPEIEQIIKAVCIAYQITFDELFSKRRFQHLTEARSICIGFIFLHHPKTTLKTMGSLFNRHHSTILNSKYLYTDLMATDLKFQKKVTIVKEFLR